MAVCDELLSWVRMLIVIPLLACLALWLLCRGDRIIVRLTTRRRRQTPVASGSCADQQTVVQIDPRDPDMSAVPAVFLLCQHLMRLRELYAPRRSFQAVLHQPPKATARE